MTVRPIILAAGQSKRMRSDVPKVLHQLCGRPLLRYALKAVEGAGLERPVVVVGHGGEAVRKEVGPAGLCVEQAQQLGTGHAVRTALEALDEVPPTVMVLYGDMPLLSAETLRALLERHQASRASMTLLTGEPADPRGLGRIIREPASGGRSGRVARIVEESDATPDERAIREVNAGTYVFDSEVLRDALRDLRPGNAQGEYYLTDVVAWALDRAYRVEALSVPDPVEVIGVNSRRELARAEAAMRGRLLDRLMDAGVTILDPQATYIHADVVVGPDTVIHPGTFLEGATRVGSRCIIGPNARLIDAVVGDEVTVIASTIEQASMGDGSRIGPYSRLRPGTRIGRYVEVGNFAEMKNSTIGDYTKVHHVSYIGDATLGARVNIGAGTVTCNLRDRSGKKWPTVIEDEAFIGSDTMLVAPVRIGRGATTGAGSVVTKDVPAGAVAVGVPARVIRQADAVAGGGAHAGDSPAPAGQAEGKKIER